MEEAGRKIENVSLSLLMVHPIFVTKYMKPLFTGSLRNDIKQYLFDTCASCHWYVNCMEIDHDQIHMLIQYNPADRITGIVSILKQRSAYLAWKNHDGTSRHHYWKEKIFC